MCDILKSAFCLKNAARRHTRYGQFDQDQYAGWQEFLAVGEVDDALQFQSQHLLKIFIGNAFFNNTAIFTKLEIFIVIFIDFAIAIVISPSNFISFEVHFDKFVTVFDEKFEQLSATSVASFPVPFAGWCSLDYAVCTINNSPAAQGPVLQRCAAFHPQASSNLR